MGKTSRLLLSATLPLIVFISCKRMDQRTWFDYFDKVGTYSSARTVDLNNDQILDVIIGAGTREEQHTDTAVIALDGATGKMLWSIPGTNQYVGSAIFKDITHDSIPDVFIGGRWAQLSAIDGATGKIIWRFFPERAKTDGSDGGWYNFTTAQFIPDQDGDSTNDIVIANGGDARKAASDTSRPAGRILILSTKTGKILANAVVPDGKETYMSVICEEKADNNWSVIFGTGGETIGGHLYRTTIKDIMSNDLSKAQVVATSKSKGFVASPVLVDITGDGTRDIVTNTAEGNMMAINGATDSLIWEVNMPGAEAYTIPAVGRFNNDTIPDFFSNFAIGTFPKLNWSVRFMVDGKTGRIEYRDTIPAFQYASPVSADLDGDGFDEVIVNQSALKHRQFEDVYYSYLMAFDFKNNKQVPLGDTLRATNLASTPWIGDLDGDGMFDIIYSAVKYRDVKFDLEQPLGLWIGRLRTQMRIKKLPMWGAFMGSEYRGVYK